MPGPPEPFPDPVPDDVRRQYKWSPSDLKWPVGEDVIKRVTGHAGLACFGSRCRARRRGSIVSKDTGLIPPGHKFMRRYACYARHPGLCFTKDKAIYKDVLKLAHNIESFCKTELRGKYPAACGKPRHRASPAASVVFARGSTDVLF